MLEVSRQTYREAAEAIALRRGPMAKRRAMRMISRDDAVIAGALTEACPELDEEEGTGRPL